MAMKELNHLLSRHYLITAPAIAIANIHIFDQTQLQSLLPGQTRQWNQLIIIQAALDHGIELEAALRRIKSSSTSGIDSSQHPREQGIPSLRARTQTCHSRDTCAIYGIQADRDAIHSSSSQPSRLVVVEKRTVGRDSNLFQTAEGVSSRLPSKRKGIKKRPKAIGEQRFTTGQAKSLGT
jgi:hypothetical protein